MDAFASMVSRVFFLVAFVLLGLSVFEALANLRDYTILRGTYTAGRLLEFAAILLIFVMAILMRQVREELRKRGA
jgi:hypothetical protein